MLVIDPAAISILNEFPLKRIRKDMSSKQYMDYTNDWNTFNSIWAYNYTANILNVQPYVFKSSSEYLSFKRGQLAHVNVYTSAAPEQFSMPK